jgi:ABC-type dipeptide/oligopeptide/nickel transport system ATPase component
MKPEDVLRVRDTRIVGLMGAAGCGKSTAAQRFLDQHPRSMHMSFARPLRMMVKHFLDDVRPKRWPITGKDYTDDPRYKNEPIPFLRDVTARKLMQTLGTEWGRNSIDPDFWVEIARVKVERTLGTAWRKDRPGSMAIVFDDVRFRNEARMLREYGGVVAQIVRPGQKIIKESAHASEAQDVTPDIIIVNDGSVLDLWQKIDVIWPSRKAEPG